MGNVAEATIKQDIDEQREQDFTRLGGGAANIVRRLKSVKVDFKLLSFIAANLALATAGSVTAVTAGTVTDEVKKGYKETTPSAKKVPTSLRESLEAALVEMSRLEATP